MRAADFHAHLQQRASRKSHPRSGTSAVALDKMARRARAADSCPATEQGWIVLDVLWSSAITLMLSTAAVLAALHIWQHQAQQQRRWEAQWVAHTWVTMLGRQWQQSGSLSLHESGSDQVTWLLPDTTATSPSSALGTPQLSMVYATPEGLSHAGCLDFLATTLGDQVNDQVTLKQGSLRCTSHSVTQPMLGDVHSWQLSWAVQVGTGWQWQTVPPTEQQIVQALEICLIQEHPNWTRSHRTPPVDCEGQVLAASSGEYTLTRSVFHSPVASFSTWAPP